MAAPRKPFTKHLLAFPFKSNHVEAAGEEKTTEEAEGRRAHSGGPECKREAGQRHIHRGSGLKEAVEKSERKERRERRRIFIAGVIRVSPPRERAWIGLLYLLSTLSSKTPLNSKRHPPRHSRATIMRIHDNLLYILVYSAVQKSRLLKKICLKAVYY